MDDRIREQFRRMANALGSGSYDGIKVSLGAVKGENLLKQRVSRVFEVEQGKTITHINKYEATASSDGEPQEETFNYSLDVGLKRKEPAFYFNPEDKDAERFDRLKVYFQGGTPMGIIKVQRGPGASGFRTSGELFFSREPNLRCTISASYFETGSLRGFLQYREDKHGYPSKYWTSDIALVTKQEFPQGRFVGSERTITADLKDSVAEEVVWKGPPADQAGYRSFYFTDGIGIQAPTRLRRGEEYFFRAWWIYKGDQVEVYENVARLMNGKLISLKSGVYTQAPEVGKITDVPSAGPVETDYVITTYTGKKAGAGTDANVIVTIFGDKGQSGPYTLDKVGDNFENGKVDTFKVKSSQNLGKITKVGVGHDNKGFAAAWYLSKITVEDTITSTMYEFPCKSWIPDKKTKSLYLELDVSDVPLQDEQESSDSEEENQSEDVPPAKPAEPVEPEPSVEPAEQPVEPEPPMEPSKQPDDIPQDPLDGLTDEDIERMMMATEQ